MDLMIDLETWAPTPVAVVRAACVMVFSKWTGTIYRRTLIDARESIDDQLEHGRQIDPGTIQWWLKQEPLSKKLDDYDDIVVKASTQKDLSIIIDRLYHDHAWNEEDQKYCDDCRIWSRGSFDMAILRSLGEPFVFDKSKGVAWRYWQERDARTLDDILKPEKSKRPHDPVADCEAQIAHVHSTFLKACA